MGYLKLQRNRVNQISEWGTQKMRGKKHKQKNIARVPSCDYQTNTNVEKHRARKWGRVMIFCASGNAFHPEKRKTTDFQNWVQAWGSDLLLNQISSLVLRQEKELL